MADQKNPKRRLKAPQTVREKSLDSRSKPIKAKRRSRAYTLLKKPFTKLNNQLKKLNKFKAFRIISKVLRFIGKIIVPSYIRSSFSELKLVTWPNRKESRRLTFAVLAFAVVFGVLIASLDYGLSQLFKAILLGKK